MEGRRFMMCRADEVGNDVVGIGCEMIVWRSIELNDEMMPERGVQWR